LFSSALIDNKTNKYPFKSFKELFLNRNKYNNFIIAFNDSITKLSDYKVPNE